MKMFKTFDELYAHTTSDSLANWLGWFEEELAENEEIYALCQCVLMDKVSIRNFDSISKLIGTDNRICAEMLLEACTSADRAEVHEFINNVMHIMHTNCPELRAEATKIYACEYLPALGETACCEEVFLWYEGIHLHGKDSVPEKFKAQIREVTNKYGCGCDITMSWLYSHLDCGIDYSYSQNEAIVVCLYADNEVTINMTKEALEKLQLVY